MASNQSLLTLHHGTTLTTATLTGLSLSLSTLAIPLILTTQSTPLLLRQATHLLQSSRTIFTRLVPLLTTAPYITLAYLLPGKARRWYLAAAVLSLVTEPYRWVFMARGERMLEARAKALEVGLMSEEGCEVEEEMMERRETSRFVVDRWGLVHLGRVGLVVGAGLCGMGAAGGLGG